MFGTGRRGSRHDDVVGFPHELARAPRFHFPASARLELLGLVQHVAAYERLTARAAVSGDPVVARKALLAHPLIGQVALVDELVDALLAPRKAASV
jgi:6-phospho-beta-glucosidase